MSANELHVSNGPDKSDLLRAVTNPDEHLHVTFDTVSDPLEAHLDRIEEIGGEGTAFALRGHVASGDLRGAMFSGVYDVATRTGRLLLRRA
jgi:hypothetical protein